jgi:hypothetical protein
MGVLVGYIIKKNKIVETVKIEKVIDKQAVLEAVKKERDNIYKSIKQTKVKETFKKPNGETTIIEKIETNTDENKIIRSDLSLNIEQKTHENDVISTNSFDHFNLSIYGGAGITNINMNQIDNLESIVFKAYSGIKFIYNSTPNLSSSIRYEYQFIKNSHSVMAEVEQKF